MDIPDYIYIIAIPILLFLGLLFFYYSVVGGWRYEVTEQEVIILLVKIPIYKIPYRNITNIEKLSGRNFFSWVRYWNFTGLPLSRLWGDAIFIKTSGKIWKSFIITPDDADTFLEEINKHLSKMQHERIERITSD